MDEDLTAARLKGHNCLIKFRDGEEMTLYVRQLASANEEEVSEWFYDVEKFINGATDVEYFPVAGIAMSRDAIKYVKKI